MIIAVVSVKQEKSHNEDSLRGYSHQAKAKKIREQSKKIKEWMINIKKFALTFARFKHAFWNLN